MTICAGLAPSLWPDGERLVERVRSLGTITAVVDTFGGEETTTATVQLLGGHGTAVTTVSGKESNAAAIAPVRLLEGRASDCGPARGDGAASAPTSRSGSHSPKRPGRWASAAQAMSGASSNTDSMTGARPEIEAQKLSWGTLTRTRRPWAPKWSSQAQSAPERMLEPATFHQVSKW